MPVACSLFYAVVSGKTEVQKIYKELPITAATITDFYNRINDVRATHGLEKYTVPSFSSVKALFSHLTTIHNNITSTAGSIGSGYGFTGTTSQNATIAGLDASKNEVNIGRYLEPKCYHNANNFTAVYEVVFNPSAFQNLSVASVSTLSLANESRAVSTTLGAEPKSIPSNTSTDSKIPMLTSLGESINNNLTLFNNSRGGNSSNTNGISARASFNGNFGDNRSWFTADSPRDGSCWDFAFQCSGDNASDFSSDFTSDFNFNFRFDFDFDFGDFGADFGVVGAALNCTRNFTANCPINYTNYKVEGIDF